jgi:hypothetical protein
MPRTVSPFKLCDNIEKKIPFRGVFAQVFGYEPARFVVCVCVRPDFNIGGNFYFAVSVGAVEVIEPNYAFPRLARYARLKNDFQRYNAAH